MNYVLTLILINLLMSCGQGSSKSSIKNFSVPHKSYQGYINQGTANKSNLQNDTYIANREYPIELSLYQDGNFYYNLPNLGNGRGKWTFKNGRLKLAAKRALFDMHIDIFSRNKEASKLAITFSDRFGPKVLPVEIFNKDN